MPTYSYFCLHCNEHLERNVKIKDRDEQDCQVCGKTLGRKIDKPGAVWAPTSTSGGMRV